MDLKVLYFYYNEDVRKPYIKEIMEEHEKYKKFYDKSEDKSKLSEPLNIDDILDVYSRRKKDFEKGGLFTDIYYLFVDYDNKDATAQLIIKTEEDEKFMGWITDEETYNYINSVFIGTGKLEQSLKKIIDIGDKLF